MTITQHISIDLQQPGNAPMIHAVQGDEYTRAVEIDLYSGGVAWNPPGGCAVTIRYGKPDGKIGVYDTLPDGETAWAVNGNIITIILAPQMLTYAGVVNAQVQLINAKQIISTFHFGISVDEDPSKGAISSEDYIPNGNSISAAQLATRLPQPDGEVQVGDYLKVAEIDLNCRVVRMERANPPTPVKGVDYWTDAERAALVLEVIDSVKVEYPEAHVIYGDIDANKVITLHGTSALPDGKYTFQFEGEDGTQVIGTITVGGPAYTNLAAPTSADWAVDKRLNSSAELVDATGCHTTNFFPCGPGATIRVKGLDIRYTNADHTQNARAWFYKDNGSPCVGTYVVSDPQCVFDGVDTFTIVIDGLANIGGGSEADIVKGRLSGMLFAGYTAADVIITVNQEIIE